MKYAKLDEQLCFALYAASNQLINIYRPLLTPIGITYTQFIALMALWEEDNVSISSLAMKTGLSKSTMTPLLKRLENKKLITRVILENNERQKCISLTKEGYEIAKLSAKITEEAFCKTGLSEVQAKELIATCHKLLNKKEA